VYHAYKTCCQNVTDQSQRPNQSQIWYQYPWQKGVLCLKDLSDSTGQHTKCIRNQNSWFLFNSMCWIQIRP